MLVCARACVCVCMCACAVTEHISSSVAAIASQIEHLAATAPETRVGIITFSDEVKLLGDGRQPEVVVAGDKLRYA